MPDIHIHLHFSEEKIMPTLNELLDRIAKSELKADTEAAEVKNAIGGLKDEVASLREIISNQPLPSEDLAPAFAALDQLDTKIDSIYTPDPVEPEPTPEPPVDPAPAPVE